MLSPSHDMEDKHAKHPIGTTATVANEFGFGPSLDPVEESISVWVAVSV